MCDDCNINGTKVQKMGSHMEIKLLCFVDILNKSMNNEKHS